METVAEAEEAAVRVRVRVAVGQVKEATMVVVAATETLPGKG